MRSASREHTTPAYGTEFWKKWRKKEGSSSAGPTTKAGRNIHVDAHKHHWSPSCSRLLLAEGAANGGHDARGGSRVDADEDRQEVRVAAGAGPQGGGGGRRRRAPRARGRPRRAPDGDGGGKSLEQLLVLQSEMEEAQTTFRSKRRAAELGIEALIRAEWATDCGLDDARDALFHLRSEIKHDRKVES